MALAQRAGLGDPVAEHVWPDGDRDVNAHLKVACLAAAFVWLRLYQQDRMAQDPELPLTDVSFSSSVIRGCDLRYRVADEVIVRIRSSPLIV